MATIVNANQPRPVRQATVSRATWHWVEWLLAQPAWKSQVAAISTEGATAHRQGLPYREAPVDKLIPDAARLDRWHGKQRSLAFLLPPSLRDLVGWLSLSPRLLVVVSPWSWPPARDSVVIAPGPPVNVARLERARRITLARLQGVPEDTRRRRADAEAFRRFLRDIDPGQRPLLFTDALTTAGRWLATDEHINTSATAAGDHGHFIACASQAGYPPLGRVATQAAGLAGVEPPQLPPSPRGRFIIAANGLT